MHIDGVIFDTDGVVTPTASVHFAAWKDTFDRFLADHAEGSNALPFTDSDYRRYVDGVSRYDGVAAFLASREIELPWGASTDEPGDGTVCALGNSKDTAFLEALRRGGIEPYRTTVRFVDELHAAGIRTAVISSSRNCLAVLEAAGVDGLFEVRVDGLDMEQLALPGKPDPAIFLEAARRLGIDPTALAVVEDAVAGVHAARDGGFGAVIGLDRTRHPEPLAEFADLVVPDASDILVSDRVLSREEPARTRLADLPDALTDPDLPRLFDGRQVAVFLDYDGTLTPIVDRPEDATLSPATRTSLEALAEVCVVGIISGRDLDDVRAMVDAEGLWYAGSHGFDVVSPQGRRQQFAEGTAALEPLALAVDELAPAIEAAPGAWLERKRFAIAVHHRATADADIPALEEAVRRVAEAHDELRMTGGKKIFELRPAVDWHKGRALRWLLDAAGLLPGTTLPVFMGDDVTDEDAFVEVRDTGLGVVVGTEERTSAAHSRLVDTDEVRAFLDWLHEELAGR